MSDIEVDLMEVQCGLEAESRAIGQARYRNKRAAPWVDAFGPQVDEASLPPGRAVLRRALEPTTKAIEVFLAAAKAGTAGRRFAAYALLAPHDVDPRALAYLTLRCGIQAGVQEHRAQKAAKMVGRAVMDHLQAVEFELANPAGAHGLQQSLAGRSVVSDKRQRTISAIHDAEGVGLGWSSTEQFQLGMKLLELAAEATGLFDLKLYQTKVGKQVRREQRLEITDKALSWLEKQHERCELLDPLPLPMVVPPRPWTTPTDGGYLQPPIGTRFVRSPSRPYREELENLDIDPVYRAVNYIQNTAWRINKGVLDVMERLTEDGGGMAGLPRRDPEPLPERPSGAEERPEVEVDWKRRRAEVHARNASGKGKRMSVAQQLWVARKLADFRAIYYPHELCWRGRVYTVPQAGPHPQAGDTGRSLLEFAEGKELGVNGSRWLAVHVANVFGVDKVSFDERVAWVEANTAAILDSAKDPLDGKRFWTTAEKPWAALAACFEWAGFIEQGAEFVSRLPIAVDGSNSGLQHLTALLRDTDAAPHVNLAPADKPGDIYSLVAAKAQAMVDCSDDPKAAPWKGGKIIRRIVKRPCMTYCFSASAFSMTEQIKRALDEIDEAVQAKGLPPHLLGADNFEAAQWLGSRLYRIIGQAVPAASRAMKWLQSVAKVMNEVDCPLWWTTPAGLPVMQRYPKTTAKKTDVTYRGKRMQLSLESELPRTPFDVLEGTAGRAMDGKKNLNGIAPNFVHSLDSAHLMLTVTAAAVEGITDIAVIHDSFGTHAADTDRLSRLLRETFVSMYEGDPLAQFRAEVVEQIDDAELRAKVPPLPDKGDLDLKSVLDAPYMFA
jgi:DNA-directed RNA polymerase